MWWLNIIICLAVPFWTVEFSRGTFTFSTEEGIVQSLVIILRYHYDSFTLTVVNVTSLGPLKQ